VIKQRITFGDYRSGERLAIEPLRTELGVSKQPIMEALRRLSAEGLVTIVPQVGCRVAAVTRRDIVDFFEIMGAVEGRAAALAAIRRSAADLEALAQVSARIGEIPALRDPRARAERYLVLNRHFHSLIHQMSGTAIVEEIGRGLYDRADFFINATASRSPLEDTVAARHADHERIRAALGRRDPAAAEKAARSHILGTVALIDAALADQP
jgi:DNA-binding GntR family transcriptional regulator